MEAHVNVPELIPVRMLNEYAYCPRLAYLEWIQGEFADNADTLQGTLRHRRVDREAGSVPEPNEGEEMEGAGLVQARSVVLSAPKDGLIARIDVVQSEGGRVTPVDYKRGRMPEVPEGAWEPERVQVCAQGLILRENGYETTEGSLYFVESKTHVRVPFTDELIARTRHLVSGLRRMAEEGVIPPPLVDSPKCVRCSLSGICLPDEVNLLRREESSAASGETRRLIPARDDAMPVYIQTQGATLGKKDDLLVVRESGKVVDEIRLIDVSHVNLMGNVQISAQLLRELAAQDIPVCHYTFGGWFSAITTGMSHKNVELRLRQYECAADAERSLGLARRFVQGKIRNARVLLRRNHPGDIEPAVRELQRLSSRASRVNSSESLLGVEGTAARVYFHHFAQLLKADEAEFEFRDRNRRPPRDPVNALLSLAYGLLVKDVTLALLAAGFDPFLGFYHRPRYGRPALALDLAEEFRPLIADSVVLSVINRGEVSAADFIRRGASVALTVAGRRRFIMAYERRMDTLITHPVFGYSISYRRVLAVQARLLGRYLTGEVPEYRPFVTR